MDSINPAENQTIITEEKFTNRALSLEDIPRFEEIELSPLQSRYSKVIALRILTINLLFIGGFFAFYLGFREQEEISFLKIGIGIGVFLLLFTILTVISYKKKAYAFREHDAIFRSGILATKITIIPYNRIQHVVLNEGLYSRIFSLASINMYTAGSAIGDLVIPGIDKEQAENLKQLLMSKIKNE